MQGTSMDLNQAFTYLCQIKDMMIMKTERNHFTSLISCLSLFTVFTLAALSSCSPQNRENQDHPMDEVGGLFLSGMDGNAIGSYLTVDNKGNPALCWTEELSEEDGHIVKFSRFDPAKGAFGDVLTVTPSNGTSAHPENMNKIAFTSDGTIVAVYSRKHPTKENRFAGSIVFTQSFDNGQTWTAERYIHSDTSPDVGRGYFDLATLPDGEVGAVWLDGRFKEMKGSALFFAKTEGRNGFGTDEVIGEGTCECCRTDLFVDQENNVHLVYRDIIDERIRDIVHQMSTDNGRTFSVAQRISRDNWEIDGCPHTGPSLAYNDEGLHAAWFTAGGRPGVYLTRTGDLGETFSIRQMVSENARHPQIVGTSDGKLVLVWDEMVKPESSVAHAGHADDMGRGAPLGSKIILQVRNEKTILESLTLSDPGSNAYFPVLHVLPENQVLVTWTQEEDGKSEIHYRVVMIG